MRTPSPWEYFSVEELACRCGCGQMRMNADFMDKIVKLRKFHNAPLPVNSGYRCPEYDRKVGSSTKPGFGPHTEGRAIDFGVMGKEALNLFSEAQKLGLFTGFGLNQKGPGRFIHVDDLEDAADHPRPYVWTY